MPSLLEPHPHLNSSPFPTPQHLLSRPLLFQTTLYCSLSPPPSLSSTSFRRDLIHQWIMDGRMEDFHLSRFSFSPSFSCRMAVVLMQGSMHWRWAQGPPTRSVCCLKDLAFCFHLFLIQTGHWQSHSNHLLSFSNFYPYPYFFIIITSNITQKSTTHLTTSPSNYPSPFSSFISSVRLVPDLGIEMLGFYWPWPPFPPL